MINGIEIDNTIIGGVTPAVSNILTIDNTEIKSVYDGLKISTILSGNTMGVNSIELLKNSTSIYTIAFSPNNYSDILVNYLDTDVDFTGATSYTYESKVTFNNGNSQNFILDTVNWENTVTSLTLTATHSINGILLIYNNGIDKVILSKKVSTVATFTTIGEISNSYLDTDVQDSVSYDYKISYHSVESNIVTILPQLLTPYFQSGSNNKYTVKLTSIQDNTKIEYPKTLTISQSKDLSNVYTAFIPVNTYKELTDKLYTYQDGQPFLLEIYKDTDVIEKEVVFLTKKSYDYKYKTNLTLTFAGGEYVYQKTFNYSFPLRTDYNWLAENYNNENDKEILTQYLKNTIDAGAVTSGVYDGLTIHHILLLLNKYIGDNFLGIVNKLEILYNNSNLIHNPTLKPFGAPLVNLNGNSVNYALKFDYLKPLYNVLTTLLEIYSLYIKVKAVLIDDNDFSKGIKLKTYVYTYDETSDDYPLYLDMDINTLPMYNIKENTNVKNLRNRAVVFGKLIAEGVGVVAQKDIDEIIGLENSDAANLDYTIPIGVKSDYIIQQDMAENLLVNLLKQHANVEHNYTLSMYGYLPTLIPGLSVLNLKYTGNNITLQNQFSTPVKTYVTSTNYKITQSNIEATISLTTQPPRTYLKVTLLKDSEKDEEQVLLYDSYLYDKTTMKKIIHFLPPSAPTINYSISEAIPITAETLYNNETSSLITKLDLSSVKSKISYIDFIQPTNHWILTTHNYNSNSFHVNNSFLSYYVLNCYVEIESGGEIVYSGSLNNKIIDIGGKKYSTFIINEDKFGNLTGDNLLNIKVYFANPNMNNNLVIKQLYSVGLQGVYKLDLITSINKNGLITTESSELTKPSSLLRTLTTFTNPDYNLLYSLNITPLNSNGKIPLQVQYNLTKLKEDNTSYSFYIRMLKFIDSEDKYVINTNTIKTIKLNFTTNVIIGTYDINGNGSDTSKLYTNWLYNINSGNGAPTFSVQLYSNNNSLVPEGIILDEKLLYNLQSYDFSSILGDNLGNIYSFCPATLDIPRIYVKKNQICKYWQINLLLKYTFCSNIPLLPIKLSISNRKWENILVGYVNLPSGQLNELHIEEINNNNYKKNFNIILTNYNRILVLDCDGGCNQYLIGIFVASPYQYDGLIYITYQGDIGDNVSC